MINKNIKPKSKGSVGKDKPMSIPENPISPISMASGVKKAMIRYILSRAKMYIRRIKSTPGNTLNQ